MATKKEDLLPTRGSSGITLTLPRVDQSLDLRRSGFVQAILINTENSLVNALEICISNPEKYSFSDFEVAANIFTHSMYLPPDAPQLKKGFEFLIQELNADSLGDIKRPLPAFVASDIMLSQIFVPSKRRVPVLFQPLKPDDDLRFRAEVDKAVGITRDISTYIQLKNQLQIFKEKVDEMFQQPVETKEQTLHRAKLVSNMCASFGTFLLGSDLATKAMSPDRLAWIKKLYNDQFRAIAGNTYAHELLKEGVLEDCDEHLRIGVWAGWGFAGKYSDEVSSGLADYFFNHPFLPRNIWKNFVGDDLLKNEEEKADRSDKSKIYRDSMMGWFLLQDEETIRKFLSSADMSQFTPSEKKYFIRKIIGYVSGFLGELPEYPNKSLVIQGIRDHIQKTDQPNQYVDELEVLEDAKPGIVYRNPEGHGRARLPRDGQTRDDFMAEQERLRTDIAYVSKAEWPEVKPEEKLNREISINGTAEWLSLWGEVLIVDVESIPQVIAALEERFTEKAGKKLDQETLFESLSNQCAQKQTSQRSIIIPSFLHEDHVLSPVRNLGIVAVDISKVNGAERAVSFILDAQRICGGLEVKKVVVNGLLTSDELSIEGTPDNFLYSPLHLAMNTLAVTGHRLTFDTPPTKEALSQIVRPSIKSWNTGKKGPTLTYLKDATDRLKDDVVVPIFLKKGVVHATVVSDKKLNNKFYRAIAF